MKRKRFKIGLLFLLMSLVVSGLIARFGVRERNLLALSARVMATSDWDCTPDNHKTLYRWQSDHELVLMHPSSGSAPGGASLLDLKTGRADPLPTPLPPRIVSGQIRPLLAALLEHESRFLTLSPDGKWLAFHTFDGFRDRAVVCARDGARVRRYVTNSSDAIHWLPDSSGFVTQRARDGKYRLQLCRPDADGVTNRVSVSDPGMIFTRTWVYPAVPGNAQTAFRTSDETAFANYTLARVMPTGRVLTRMDSTSPVALANSTSNAGPVARMAAASRLSPVLALNEYDLHTNAQTRHIPIRLPANFNPFFSRNIKPPVSPQGDRLAWGYIVEETPPFLAWLHRRVASIAARPQTYFVLRVSALDGGNSREIARLPLSANARNPLYAFVPYGLQWTPDGKRLSYIYRDALYTIPVD